MTVFRVGRTRDISMQGRISIARLRPAMCINIPMGSGNSAYYSTGAASGLGLNMIDPFHDIRIVLTLAAY